MYDRLNILIEYYKQIIYACIISLIYCLKIVNYKNMKQSIPIADSSSPDLQIALNALYMSMVILYYKFHVVFKAIGLVVLAYISYRIGRASVSQPIASNAKKIENQIKRIEEQKQQLPTRIKKISGNYIKLIALFIALFAGGVALVYSEQVKIDIKYLAPLLIAPIVLYIVKTIHVSSLKSKNKQFVEQEKQIRENVKQLNKVLGSKVQSSLRNTLCRDKIVSKQNAPYHICVKKDCQQLREALRIRYQAIRALAESALQFQWCSTCKSRKPFDQLVKFQAKPMPVPAADISEQQDADIKINYLMQVLEEIDKWIQQAGPCNCSKLYMQEVLKSRKQSSKVLKEIGAKIEQLQKQRQASATIVRSQSRTSNASNASNVSNASSVQSGASSGSRVVYSGSNKKIQ